MIPAATLASRRITTRPSPSRPGRAEVIASYGSADETRRAIVTLHARGVPLAHLALRLRGLRVLDAEPDALSSRLTVGQGVGPGAFVGAVLGLLFGAVVWFSPPVGSVEVFLWALVVGAVVGAVVGLLNLLGREVPCQRRSFGATRYDLVAHVAVAKQARRALPRSETNRTA